MATDFIVKGEWATKNEYNVSLALDYYEIEYEFHVDVLGGSAVRGGYVIDFVINIPWQVPLEVFGNYWHEGYLSDGDKLKLANIQDYYGVIPIIIWGNESDTPEQARDAIKDKVL